MVDRLEKLVFPTYVIFPKNFDGILTSIRHVGQILSREKEAQEIISNMQARRQRVIELTRGLPRPRVFLQIGEAPVVTVGKGSFADDLIYLAGGENITAADGKMYPRLGLEEILHGLPKSSSSAHESRETDKIKQDGLIGRRSRRTERSDLSDRLGPDRPSLTKNHRWARRDGQDHSSGEI
jgi:hypothetical protein